MLHMKPIFAIHNIKVMVGTESQQGQRDYLYAFRKNYISAAVDQMFAGDADQFMNNDGYADQYARMNYFGRVNYDLMQKYMAEFVWRYDGSYMFPKGKQFGFFPAFHLDGVFQKKISGRTTLGSLIISNYVHRGDRPVMTGSRNTNISLPIDMPL